ncbi:MAG TPA: ATP-binding protein [Terriglobales bacterium]|nr:ATP-binding protein [Terriglobales bacterium]
MSTNLTLEPPQPAIAGPISGPSSTRQKTILVVDDRAINRDFLVSLLKHFGYKMREAESAEQAWGIVASGAIDLIITDVCMGAIDGLNLLEKLAAEPSTARIPAIVYTASHKHINAERMVHARQLYAVLTKPTAPETIVETVHRALGVQPGLENLQRIPENGNGSRATALIEIMQDLAEQREILALVRTFCNASKELVHVHESFIFILPRDEELSSRVFSSARSPEMEEEIPYPQQMLADLKRVINGHAVGRFREVNPREYGIPIGNGKLRSLLCVPLYTPSNDYGCVCFVEKQGAPDFDDEDERLAATLTSYMARLYENTVFCDELQSLTVRLTREAEDRKLAEEELDRTRKQQIRLKDEFLSHVSHELRSPLMALQQFLEILKEGVSGPLNGQQREYLDIALRNTDQLGTMISDLLDTTRVQSGKLRVDLANIPLPDILREAVVSARPAAQQKQIQLNLEIAAELPLVVADRSRVRQIATNFLDNAIKFTDAGGSVELKACLDPSDAKFVRINVTDTGCGMDPEETDHIFTRLYQIPGTRVDARAGLGLGLGIVKELVSMHGGKIEVRSEKDRGSEFSFTLPVFSIANLLGPIFAEQRANQALVLMIEVPPPQCESADLMSAARDTVERCILPDLDVVLPGSYPAQEGRMLVVVAQADDVGAQVMLQRLQQQLKANDLLADVSFNISQQSIPELWPEGKSSTEEYVSAIAARVNDRVQAILT